MTQQKWDPQVVTRRSIHKTAVGAGLATMAYGPFTGKVLGANEQVRLGVVGMRGQGSHDSFSLSRCPGVTVSAACDMERRELDKYVSRYHDEFKTPPRAWETADALGVRGCVRNMG